MSDIKQVLLCGLGGQGVVTAGKLLGGAAFSEGMHVSGTSSYGAAARGGECRAEVVISDAPIAFPFLTKADILVALSQTAYERYLEWTAHETALVFFDTLLVEPVLNPDRRHVGIPATKSADESLRTKLGANIVMLAAVVQYGGIVGNESLVRAVEDISPGRFRDQNLRALELGFQIGSDRLRDG
ncbi:MAG: 2-oxoacid:acceptor oxidoreductase family protein [Dehalococcoidia bacterium]|nr:2-oxoacid:acceptor oxidoreductase family protein [Dehalococcoidia bacterium]